MEEVLNKITQYVAYVIEMIAVLVVAWGSALALLAIFRRVIRTGTDEAKRGAWLEYARWLVAALTFQLAADIVRTAISPTWADVGKTGAIAVIRTFLTYFLDRDMDQLRGRAEQKA